MVLQCGGQTRIKGNHASGEAGVYVAVDDRVVNLLNPVPTPVLPEGPEEVTGLDARDLDGDGVLEYLVRGTSGDHIHGLWVCHWDAAAGNFRLRGHVWGDKSIFVSAPTGQTVIGTNTRDYNASNGTAVLTHRYTWRMDHFVETH